MGWDVTLPQVLLGLAVWMLFCLLVAYYAVAQLGAVQAVLAMVLRRTLHQMEVAASQDSETEGRLSGCGGVSNRCKVRHTASGVEVEGLHLGGAHRAALAHLFFEVKQASVTSAEVQLPTWRAPLVVRVRGVRLELQQRNMPTHMDCAEVAAAAAARQAAIRQQKLDILERLLWATDFGGGAVGASPEAAVGRRRRWSARLMHRCLGFAVQRAEVHVADVSVTYAQQGEPGPRLLSSGRLAGRDAVTLRLRTLDLQPEGPRQHHTAQPGSRPPSAEAVSTSASSSAQQPPLPQQPWAVFQLFGWRQAAAAAARVRQPIATRLQLAGISLSLATWRRLPSGVGQQQLPHASAAAPQEGTAVSPAQSAPPEAAVASTADLAELEAANGGGRRPPAWQQQQRDNTGDASRRRQGGQSSASSPQQVPPNSAQHQKGTRHLPQPASKPAAEFVILQQWGAEVVLTVLPPGQRPDAAGDAQQSAAAEPDGSGGKAGPAPGQAGPSLPGSPASFQSWSIPAGATNGHPPPRMNGSASSMRQSRRQSSAGSSSRGAAQRASESGTACLPGGSPTLDIVASVRACVLQLGAPELAICLRLLQTFQDYARSHHHWRTRPQASVAADPATWWRHAINAVRQECHAVRRQQACLQQLSKRRRLRLRYQALYAAARMALPAFREPDLRWWQRRKVAPADAAAVAELGNLEKQLSLEEAAHFRAGVAAVYSANLAGSPDALYKATIGVDAIVASHSVPSNDALAMLFAHPKVPKAVPPPPVLLRLTASLPKAGVLLQLGSADSKVERLEALLSGTSFSLAEDNELALAVEALRVCGTPPSSAAADMIPVVVSPSPVAAQHCHVARSYIGVAEVSRGSFMPLTPQPLRPEGPPFLDMRMQRSPEELVQMPAATEKGQGGAKSEITQRRPAHSLLKGAVAGICISFEPTTLNAAMDFYTSVVDYIADSDELNGTAFSNAGLDPHGASAPLSGSSTAQLEGLPKLVSQTFARHGIPLAAPLAVPPLNMAISCPAVVVRVPYTYDDAVMRPDGQNTSAPFEAAAVLSDVQASIFGDEFWRFVETGGGGALQRCSVAAWIDVFCAHCPQNEQQQVLDDAALDGICRVWAHPEDAAAHFEGRRSSMGSSDAASSQLRLVRPSTSLLRISTTGPASAQRASPARFTRASNDAAGPADEGNKGELLPLIPILRLAAARAEGASRTAPLPAPPGNASLGLAVSALGLQVWLSPYQVAHGVAVAEHVAATLPRFRAAPMPPPAAAVAAEAAKEAVPEVVSTLAVMRRRQRLLISAEFPVITVLCLVANPAGAPEQRSQQQQQQLPRPVRRHSMSGYGRQAASGGSSWEQGVMPVYSISLVASRALCKYKGTGEISAGLLIDGLMARDLSCPPAAKHAFILRPLPTRAERLQQFAATQRAEMLRYTAMRPAAQRWVWAVQTLLLRRRSERRGISRQRARSSNSPFHTLPGGVVAGPQLAFSFERGPDAALLLNRPPELPPAPAEVTLQVGHLLAITQAQSKDQALPLFTQTMELLRNARLAAGRRSSVVGTAAAAVVGAVGGGAGRSASRPVRPRPPKESRTTACGFVVKLQLVGCDAVLLVEGRELLYLKLLDVDAFLSAAPPGIAQRPGEIKLSLALNAGDIALRDMQARPEHSHVLRPNAASAASAYTEVSMTLTVPASGPPQLQLEVASPRFLLLQRFVLDVIYGIQLFIRALAPAKAAQRGLQEAAATAGAAPAAGGQPTPLPAPRDIQASMRAEKVAEAREAAKQPPLVFMLTVTNAAVLVPLHSTSVEVLAAELDTITLAMPGSAVPAEQLAAADLPSLPAMLAEALDEDCDYARGTSVSAQAGKKSEHHSRPPPQPPPGPQPYHHRSPPSSPQRGSPQRGSPDRGPAAEASAAQASSSAPQSSQFQGQSACDAAAHGAGKDVPEADSATAAAAAATKQRRSKRHARWKQRIAGVIHVDTQQPGDAAGRSLPAGVVAVRLPDEGQAAGDPADTAPEAGAAHPAPGARAADQQHTVAGAASAPAGSTTERAGGIRGQGLARTDGPMVTHSPESQFAQPQREPRQVQMVQLSTGGRRPVSPLRPALKPGQTPFGTPHVQQRPLDGSQRRQQAGNTELVQSLAATSQLTVLASGLAVVHAYLQPVHMDHEQDSDSKHFITSKLGAFCVPCALWDVGSRTSFVSPTSLGVLLFERPGVAQPAVHLTAPRLHGVLNQRIYQAIMGIVKGNVKEGSSFPGGKQPAQEPQSPQRTRINKGFKFGPARGDPPRFRLTVAVPELRCVLEADPTSWDSPPPAPTAEGEVADPLRTQEPLPASAFFTDFLGAGVPHRPMLLGTAAGVQLDLGILSRTKAVHIAVGAKRLALDDLRLAYRMQQPSLPDNLAWRLGSASPLTPQPALPQLQQPAGSARRSISPAMPRSVAGRCTPQPARGAFRRTSSMRKRTPPVPSLLAATPLDAATPPMRAPAPAATAAGEFLHPMFGWQVVPEMAEDFPDGVPLLSLLSIPVIPVQEEAAHLKEEGEGQDAANPLEVAVAVMTDGTVGVEVASEHAQLQWPFLSDVSMIDALVKVFQLPQHLTDAQPNTTFELGTMQAGLAAKDPVAFVAGEQRDLLLKDGKPFVYVNVVLSDSQAFVPVLDMPVLAEAVDYFFGEKARVPASTNMHDRLMDLLLTALSFSLDDPEGVLALEERGLVLAMTALRVAYAGGGDGEMALRADIRNMAGFVRDPSAAVTAAMLPLSAGFKYDCKVPQAAEAAEAARLQAAASTVQRWWRRRRWQMAVERKRSQPPGSARRSKWGDVAAAGASLFVNSAAADVKAAKEDEAASTDLIEGLVIEYASPRTRKLLQDYAAQHSQAGTGPYGLQKPGKRQTATHDVSVNLGTLTARAAFSHVPFWQSVAGMVGSIVQRQTPGNPVAQPSRAAEYKEDSNFRPVRVRVAVEMAGAALLLCTDRVGSFGAPDVVEVALDRIQLDHALDARFSDRPPDQALRLGMRLAASFLNNSSSRWETLAEPWEARLELIEHSSPIYRSDHQRQIWVSSEQHLNLHFNPAGLLSIGDALAFAKALQAAPPAADGQLSPGSPLLAVPSSPTGAGNNVPSQPEAVPPPRAQLGLAAPVSGRAPQKYLIQNQTGLPLYYWADKTEKYGAQKTCLLEPGVSETLRVKPVPKRLRTVAPGKGTWTERWGTAINLHFDGNWMPLLDVSVSVVGKYRYLMDSALRRGHLPVIVDIFLVGRTKIITLHSSIWASNVTDRALSLRLHIPITSLAAPSGATTGADSTNADAHVAPLLPGRGTYLPLTAVLGGSLFVRAEGYREADRDVVRLSPHISELQEQAGYLMCQAEDPAAAPLHCVVRIVPAQVNSEFQSFKHVEILGPGEHMRAQQPLEATLAIHPTVVLTNALPYPMHLILWQVAPLHSQQQKRQSSLKRSVSSPAHGSIEAVAAAAVAATAGPGSPTGARSPHTRRAADTLQDLASVLSGTMPLGPEDALVLEELLKKASSGDPAASRLAQEAATTTLLGPWRDGAPVGRAGRARGAHLQLTLPPGRSQSLYADLTGNVLLHASVPALGLRADQWAIISWGHTHAQLPDFADSRFTYRLAKEIKVKSDVSVLPSALPGKQDNPFMRRLKALTKALKERSPMDAAKAPPGNVQPALRRARKAAAATNSATAEAAAAEQKRSETEAFYMGRTGRAAPGVADRVMAAGGAAVGLGAAAVGGATVAGRAVADVGVDAGRGALDVMSKVIGRKPSDRQVKKVPSAAERLEALRTETSRPSSFMGNAAAAIAHGAQRVQSNIADRRDRDQVQQLSMEDVPEQWSHFPGWDRTSRASSLTSQTRSRLPSQSVPSGLGPDSRAASSAGAADAACSEEGVQLQRTSTPPPWPDDTPYGQVGRLRERFGGTPADTPRKGSLTAELPDMGIDSRAGGSAAGQPADGAAAVNGAVWDGSIFDVAERLESGDGFGPPAVGGNAAQPSDVRATGVSFAALPPSSAAASNLQSSQSQQLQQGSHAAGQRRSALRQSRPDSSGEITGLSRGQAGSWAAEDFAEPPDHSRARLTTEDGNALEPQPLLAGQGGSPKRMLPGMRQRGSSCETSPSTTSSSGDEAEQQLQARFVSELRPSTASAAGAEAATRSPSGAEDDSVAGLPPLQTSSGSGQRPRSRRESDLIRWSEAGEPPAAASAAEDDRSLSERAEAHYKEELTRTTVQAWRSQVGKRRGRRVSKQAAAQRLGAAPSQLFLGIDNSMAGGNGDHAVCEVTLYAPYWLDNRTGLDLGFQDAPSSARLLGYRATWDYNVVIARGSGPGGFEAAAGGDIVLPPTLMNKQDQTALCLANTKEWSRHLPMHTVGLKGSIQLRGPVVQSGAARRRSVLTRQASGSPGSVAAGPLLGTLSTAGAVPSSRTQVQPAERKLVTVDILVTDSSADPGHLRHSSAAVNGSFSTAIGKRALAEARGLKPSASGAVRKEPKLVEVVLSVAPWADGNMRSSAGRLHRFGNVRADHKAAGTKAAGRKPLVPEALQRASLRDKGDSEGRQPPGKGPSGRRLYELVVSVMAGPPSSAFRNTKVLTVSSKFVVENQTGVPIEVKQRGAPDTPVDAVQPDGSPRPMRRLGIGERAALHWEDAELERMLVMRPLEADGSSRWEWSGGFAMAAKEAYFGLRVRHAADPSRAVNIPVNTTVGPSGSVLITFKSRLSLPPYRIENATSDVAIWFAQDEMKGSDAHWNWLTPRPGGTSMPFAWDEPLAPHKLRVHAQVKRGRPVAAEYSLDVLGDKQQLSLPTHDAEQPASVLGPSLSGLSTRSGGTGGGQTVGGRSGRQGGGGGELLSDDMREKLATVLAKEFSRKVYVTVYSDGPTRVLRLSDEPNITSREAEQSVLDLAARLKQVEAQLLSVDGKFLRLHGVPAGRALDLFGRTLGAVAGDAHEAPRSQRRNLTTLPPSASALRLRTLASGGPAPTPSRAASVSKKARQPAAGLAPMTPSTVKRAASLPMPSRTVSFNDQAELSAASIDRFRVDLARESSYSTGGLPAPSAQPGRMEEVLAGISQGDAALLVGGDLTVLVLEAEGLVGEEKATHPFARVSIGSNVLHSAVAWQSTAPLWDEKLAFKEVSVAAELTVEVRDLGGASKHASQLAADLSEAVSKTRFLGRAEVPLASTLSATSEPKWYTLMRRAAGEEVGGRVRLAFEWDITARGLLALKLAALERVLAQRTEILCMLHPVTPATAAAWSGAPGMGFPRDGGGGGGGGGEGAGQPVAGSASTATIAAQARQAKLGSSSELAVELMAKHQQEEFYSSLSVSVLEVKGLRPRRGVVATLQANDMPNPVVEVGVANSQKYAVAAARALQARFPSAPPVTFRQLPPDATLQLRVYDGEPEGSLCFSGGKLYPKRLLGQADLALSHIEGEDPVYMWLPCSSGPPGLIERALETLQADDAPIPQPGTLPDLQVYLRLQWVSRVVRGVVTRLEVGLAGLSLSVAGGLQDELLNLTARQLSITNVMTTAEFKVRGTIQRVQLDDQMLLAAHPVVLAPAGVSQREATTEAGSPLPMPLEGSPSAAAGPQPLISFGLTRSFAGKAGEEGAVVKRKAARDGAADGQVVGNASHEMLSFKEIYLFVGELTLEADEAFLEALLTFFLSIPLADVYQDEQWEERQRRLLTAQFGPNEVESLALNVSSKLSGGGEEADSSEPLRWIKLHQAGEIKAMKSQASYSSWYFVERAAIGDIHVNCTIALSSAILASSRRAPQNADVSRAKASLFGRVIGAAGFQLINVNNVSLRLGGWQTDTQLVSKTALAATLLRHYRNEVIKEAHKVLAGAGPAVAAVPLVVVWAGGSAVSLLRGVASGQVGVMGTASRIGFVSGQSIAQVLNAFSRMGASVLTWVPPPRAGYFSDTALLQRVVQRPQSSLDAFARGVKEGGTGIITGVTGLVLDPMQGYNLGGVPLLAVGCGKGVAGVLLRPTIGGCEFASKAASGLSLACLGKQGIVGNVKRRVRPPGAAPLPDEDSLLGLETEARQAERRAAELARQELLAAWQAALPALLPHIANEQVEDVVAVSLGRALLLTDGHIIMLRSISNTASRGGEEDSQPDYRRKWRVRTGEVQAIKGDEDTGKITIEYARKFVGLLGTWTVPLKHRIRCAGRAAYLHVNARLSHHLAADRAVAPAATAHSLGGPAPVHVPPLSILDEPYSPR